MSGKPDLWLPRDGAIYPVAKLAAMAEIDSPGLARCHQVLGLGEYVLARLGADGSLIDPSSASAMGLYELSRGAWSEEILGLLGLGRSQLPRLAPAGTRAGGLAPEIASETGLPVGLPLFVGGADQQCALLGAQCHGAGGVVLSLGTSAAIQCLVEPRTTGADVVPGLLTLAHVDAEHWVLEGFQKSFGGALTWACLPAASPTTST